MTEEHFQEGNVHTKEGSIAVEVGNQLTESQGVSLIVKIDESKVIEEVLCVKGTSFWPFQNFEPLLYILRYCYIEFSDLELDTL